MFQGEKPKIYMEKYYKQLKYALPSKKSPKDTSKDLVFF